jgi:hypothetical protein
LALLEALAAGVYATCLLALQFYIFSQMAAGKIGSDFPSHLALISQKKEGVPHFMFHLAVEKTSQLFHMDPARAAPWVLVGGSCLALILLAMILKNVRPMSWPQSLFWVTSLKIVTGIWIPALHPNIIIGTGSPNLYHNPTSFFAQPWGFAIFLIFCKVTSIGEKRIWLPLFFACPLVILTALAKPNFLFSLLSAIPFFLFFCKKQGCHKEILFLFICGFTALIILALQTYVLYGASSQSSSGIGFGVMEVWKIHAKYPLLNILLLTAFPLSVWFLFPEYWKDPRCCLAFLLALFSILIPIFIFESGPRKSAGNFFWGITATFPILCTCSLGVILKQPRSMKTLGCFSLLFIHYISGLAYLYRIIFLQNPA